MKESTRKLIAGFHRNTCELHFDFGFSRKSLAANHRDNIASMGSERFRNYYKLVAVRPPREIQ